MSEYENNPKKIIQEWDAGNLVKSVEMGGLGPSYEQAIQITAMELLRFMIDQEMDASKWDQPEASQKDANIAENYIFSLDVIKNLGLSGAQLGAAKNLASMIYKQGPDVALSDPIAKERKIFISKNFPSYS